MFVVTYDNYEGAVLGLTKYFILPVIVIGPFLFPSIVLWNDGQVLYAATCLLVCLSAFYFSFKARGFRRFLAILGVLGCWLGGILFGDHLQKSFEARDNEVRHIVSIVGYDFGGHRNSRIPPLGVLFPEEINEWSNSLNIRQSYSDDNMSALVVPISDDEDEREHYVIKPKSMMRDYHRLAARHGDWFGLARDCAKADRVGAPLKKRPLSCSSWGAIKEHYGIDVPVRLAALFENAPEKSCADYVVCNSAEQYFGLALPEETTRMAAKN